METDICRLEEQQHSACIYDSCWLKLRHIYEFTLCLQSVESEVDEVGWILVTILPPVQSWCYFVYYFVIKFSVIITAGNGALSKEQMNIKMSAAYKVPSSMTKMTECEALRI